MKCKIGKATDEEIKEVEFKEGDTIQDLLDREQIKCRWISNGFVFEGYMRTDKWNNVDEVLPTDLLKEGMIYLFTKYHSDGGDTSKMTDEEKKTLSELHCGKIE